MDFNVLCCSFTSERELGGVVRESFALRFIIDFLLLDLLQLFRDRLLSRLHLFITNYILVLHDVLS